ncbi:MAG TPA: hypothetical protein VF738_01725 [Rhodanobacter sp.]
MRMQHVFVLSLGLAVIGAMPALAYQGRGAGGQGQRGQAQPPAGAMRGMTQQDRLRDRDQIYGWQLMTPAERSEYRMKMRSLKTVQEREALRSQHHEEMQKRAQQRGVTLPDMPRQNRGGAGMQQRMQQRNQNQAPQIQRQRIRQQQQQQQQQQSQGQGQ